MFDIGFTELVLIGIVALVVIGPERLPAVARTAGQWIAKLQRFVKGVKTDLASELDSGDLKKLIGDQRDQIDELRSLVSSASKDFHSSTSDVVKSAKKRMNELETSIKDEESLPAGETKALGDADAAEAEADEYEHAESGADVDATAEVETDSAVASTASKESTSTGKAQSEATIDSTPDDSSSDNSTSAQEDHSPITKPSADSSDMGRTGS